MQANCSLWMAAIYLFLSGWLWQVFFSLYTLSFLPLWGSMGRLWQSLHGTALLFFDLFFPPPTQLSAAPIHTNLPATLRHKRQLPHDKSTWMIVYSWSRTVIFVAFLLPFSLSSARSDGFIKSLCCFTVNMGH